MLGVSGATYGTVTPPPAKRVRESVAPRSDMFAPSNSAPTGIYSRPRLPEARPSQTPRLAAWAAAVGMLLSGTWALALPAPPSQDAR